MRRLEVPSWPVGEGTASGHEERKGGEAPRDGQQGPGNAAVPLAPPIRHFGHHAAARSFWLTALVGLPVGNGVLLFAAASVEHTFLVPELALVAFGELALLIVLAWKYRIGVFGAIGAILGNAAITVLGVVLVYFVALAIACSDATECL